MSICPMRRWPFSPPAGATASSIGSLAPMDALITGYPDLAAAIPPAHLEPSALRRHPLPRSTGPGGGPGSLVAVAGGTWVTIVVAHTRDERLHSPADIFANAFLPVPARGLVAGGPDLVRRAPGAGAAGSPSSGWSAIASPTDLTPDRRARRRPRCGSSWTALNRFMERLQANLALMQTFLADAAHQIRTPLATLRAQADLAVEEDDPASLRAYVYKIHRNAALASQVTNQLLSHTMVAIAARSATPRASRSRGAPAAGGAARRGGRSEPADRARPAGARRPGAWS